MPVVLTLALQSLHLLRHWRPLVADLPRARCWLSAAQLCRCVWSRAYRVEIRGECALRQGGRWQRRQALIQQHRTTIARLQPLSSALCLLPPPCHERIVTVHAEHALRSPRIPQVFDLLLAVATSKTAGAIGLVASQNSEVLDLVATGTAAVRAVVADQRAVA